ncbi:MAG TPA: hypothetical protein VGU26_04475, partial [Gaiellaceae bacterium]|nr:hypothetical protein [Gaiellaceae bacterium]
TALCADPALVGSKCGAVAKRVLRAGPRGVLRRSVAEGDEVRGGGDRELGEVARPVAADRGGYVGRLGALAVGVAAMRLGAGRVTKDDRIDHAVGIVCLKKRGDRVQPGEVVAEVHAEDEAAAEAAAADVVAAYDIVDEEPATSGVILDTLA